jgi:hypothetical protein
MIALFGLHGRDVADRLEKASGVEPIDPLEGGELDRLEAAPGTAPPDHLRLEETDDRLGERVDAPMFVKCSSA